jgi:hypothetical protein
MAPSVKDALLRKTKREVVTTLVHMKRLLRVRNRLCSPLLRLPTEIIVRILAYIMAGLLSPFRSRDWMPIYRACHHIHRIMCSATELWWRVDCTNVNEAHFIFVRSNGGPRVILSDLRSMGDVPLLGTERMLDHWRDELGFRGHLLHTLEFYGGPSSFSHFSWIFEHPLPRVESLKINIVDLDEEIDDLMEPLENPVPLELPVDMPLRVLDLRNIVLSWSSYFHLFNGLRELHLSFRGCYPTVEIPEDELFGILDASPQLEHLSLLQVGCGAPVGGNIPRSSRRVLQFPNLASLRLDNSPDVIKYTLTRMDLPMISSLTIRSSIPLDATHALVDLFFPDDRLLTRLFSNLPTFAVRTVGKEGPESSIETDIGSVRLRLDFYPELDEGGWNIVMSSITQLVPQSVTALDLECTNLGERGWRDFFTSHSEVRSIECKEFCGVPVSATLWNALSPTGEEDAGVPCPRLESISITSFTTDMVYAPLTNCLRNRQIAGSKLKCLDILDYHGLLTDAQEFHEEFDPFVGTVKVDKNGFSGRVSPVSIRELGMC